SPATLTSVSNFKQDFVKSYTARIDAIDTSCFICQFGYYKLLCSNYLLAISVQAKPTMQDILGYLVDKCTPVEISAPDLHTLIDAALLIFLYTDYFRQKDPKYYQEMLLDIGNAYKAQLQAWARHRQCHTLVSLLAVRQSKLYQINTLLLRTAAELQGYDRAAHQLYLVDNGTKGWKQSDSGMDDVAGPLAYTNNFWFRKL
ncbi:hypothetical protein H4R35_005133, partial [Dimargaris xerosporica]